MKLNWVGNRFDRYSGYGRMGGYFVRELCRRGVDVAPTLLDALLAPDWLQPSLTRFDPNHLTISLMYGAYLPKLAGRQWGFTMYEDTGIPDGWADLINARCERLLVLCEHNADTFRRGGVTVPIHVVHGGTDPDEFPLVERRVADSYTFLCLGDAGERKGVMIAWMAFHQAFQNGEDVRLIIKTRQNGMQGVMTESFHAWDNRIEVWKADVDNIADVYRQADCFVFPSYGEGWGMPPREAAMMGLPVIATNWSGLEVGIEQWALPVNNYTLQPARLKSKNAHWAVPSVDAVADQMRWCYDHPDDARRFGRQASDWLRENQTWAHSAQRIVELLEAYG